VDAPGEMLLDLRVHTKGGARGHAGIWTQGDSRELLRRDIDGEPINQSSKQCIRPTSPDKLAEYGSHGLSAILFHKLQLQDQPHQYGGVHLLFKRRKRRHLMR
jgi:hypothetical protein